MNKELIPTDKGIKLVGHPRATGCIINTAIITIVILVLSLIFLLPEVGIVKRGIGTFVILFGIMFTSFGLATINKQKNKVLITIEDGYIKNDKQTVALSEIVNVTYGWHTDKFSGGVFEDLIVTTKKKKYYFRYYNIVTHDAIEQLVEEYILPYAAPECKANWEKRVKHPGWNSTE